MQEKWRFNGFYSQAQLARWREAAPRRYSCRQMGEKPTIAQWTALSFMAARCCLPGVRLVLGECDPCFFSPVLLPVLRITGARRFAALVTDGGTPAGRLNAGISGEAFVLEAAANGVATVWVSGTYRKRDCPVKVKPGEQVLCVIALGQPEAPWPEKPERKRKAVEKYCLGDLNVWPQWAQSAARAVQEAPSALNSQPWQLDYGAGSLGLFGPPKNELDLGIALLHMETALTQPHLWTLGSGPREAARVRLTAE